MVSEQGARFRVHVARGQHAEALAELTESLAISRRRGTPIDAAYCLDRLTGVHIELGRYDLAISSAEEAVAIFRQANDRLGLAEALGSLGVALNVSGHNARALAAFEEALRLNREGGRALAAAITLDNMAGAQAELGRYDEAMRLYEQALTAMRTLGAEANVASTLNDMGTAHMSLGAYDQALGCFEQAIAINRRLNRAHALAVSLGNLGGLYNTWGRPDRAMPYFDEAITIDRAAGRQIRVAENLSGMASAHMALAQMDKALAREEEALAIYRRGKAEALVAYSLSALGNIERDLGRLDAAQAHFEEALALNRRLGLEAQTADSLHGLGTVLMERRDYATARDRFAEALVVFRRQGRRPTIATSLSYLAIAESSLGEKAAAIAKLEEAVGLLDALRQTAKGDMRRDYMVQSLNTYQHLVDLHARLGHADAALEASERARAKQLAELLAGREEVPTSGVAALRAAMPAQSAALVYAAAAKPEMIQMVLTREAVTARLQRTEAATAPAPAARPASAPTDTRGVAIEEPESESSPDLAGLVSAYRSALLARDTHRTRAHARALYDMLIRPLESRLAGKTELVVIPDAALGFLPFEGLVDPQGRYLGERFRVTYAHSLAVRGLLANRKHPADRKPLLAFGGAQYQAAKAAERGASTPAARMAAYQSLSRGEGLQAAYGQLGFGTWADLPGTLREVAAIAKLQPGAEVVTGAQVTEARLKAMAKADQLGRYRVLHFATHGLTVPEVPELSALVLSQTATQPGGEDGYLRADEVARLPLRADFVNLSACETGLGKLYGGEGVVGLAQSFLVAGANGLSMSLWSVADDSTATFMTELYKTAAKDRVGHAEAAARVKRRFIKGEFGEAYKHPYYWAPFVHYGL
ncbi:Regulatory protein AfsR [compost metagenome]